LKKQYKNSIFITLSIIVTITVLNIVLYSFQEININENPWKYDKPKQCLDCHNKIIKVNGREIENIGAKYKMKHIHDPYELGCTGCHKIHSQENKSMLITPFFGSDYIEGKPESFKMCYSCHPTESLTIENTEKVTKFRNGSKNLHFLHVNKTKGRNCILCHDVHGSNNPKLIKDKVKFGNWMMPINFIKTKTGGSCAPGCHAQLTYDINLVEKPKTITVYGKVSNSENIEKALLKDLKIYIQSINQKLSDSTILNNELSFALKNLTPGIYQIWIDSVQLNELNLLSNPAVYSYEIKHDYDLNKPSNMLFTLQKMPLKINEIDNSEDVFFDYETTDEVVEEKTSNEKAAPKTDNTNDSANTFEKNINPIQPPIKKKNVIRIKKGETKVFSMKESKKTEIVPEMKSYLKSLAKYLKKFPKMKLLIEVEIYENTNLKEKENQSDEYSAKIVDYFTSKGISSTRFVVQKIYSQSESKLNTESKNHRIHLKIIN
jgi:predicted CXXCH cytochrome family protein